MTLKERVLARGAERVKNIVEIETKDGDVYRFELPHTGPDRTSYRRGQKDFVTLQSQIVNPGWVAAGLIPTSGMSETDARMIFDLHWLSTEGWTQEDVLEMYKVNPIEIEAVWIRLTTISDKLIGDSAYQSILEKKASSQDSGQDSSTSGPASDTSESLPTS